MSDNSLRSPLKAVRSQLLVEQVTESLIEGILDGTFQGGDQLVENQLQKELGVSRSPLRESMRILQTNGLVDIIPHKGTFVKKITSKEIEENLTIRVVLEGLAAKLAYKNKTQEFLDSLKQALDKMEQAISNENPNEYKHWHSNFHELYNKASNNDLLITLLKQLRMHTVWHHSYFKIHQQYYDKFLTLHKKIWDAFTDETLDENTVGEKVSQSVQDGFNIAKQHIKLL